MTRWEYLYFTDPEKETSTLHPPTPKEKLNKLGQEGWELIGRTTGNGGKPVF